MENHLITFTERVSKIENRLDKYLEDHTKAIDNLSSAFFKRIDEIRSDISIISKELAEHKVELSSIRQSATSAESSLKEKITSEINLINEKLKLELKTIEKIESNIDSTISILRKELDGVNKMFHNVLIESIKINNKEK